MTPQERVFYKEVRDNAKALLDAANNLVELQVKWNAWDYGTGLVAGEFEHEGLDKDDLGPAIFEVADAIEDLLDASTEAKRKILAKII